MQRQAIPFDSFAILFTLKSCTHLRNLPFICHLHVHLLKLGVNIHVYVATSLLNAYVGTSFEHARKVFNEMPVRNIVTWNTMITCFSRSGDVERARKMFDEMPVRDLASWSAMIAGNMNNGHYEEGVAVFREMVIVEQLKPDQVTVGLILAGCLEMGTSIELLLGKSVHGFAVKNNWELNVELGTCLVDMYAKCRFLNFASLVFDMMKDRNVVTWTALICGAAMHGFGNEALEIFKIMRQGGVLPIELTFTGVLSACVQVGLVDEGRGYFKMIKECGLRPTIQHYGMVDLFGKAGLLGEAYEVINTMSREPNVVIWGPFLSSCKLHKQFEMSERVIEKVMNAVRPENDGGVYTLISDLYVLGDNGRMPRGLGN